MRTQTLPANASSQQRGGFTITELLVTMAIIAMFIALLLPSVRSTRGPARRTQCINNSRQMVLAILNYESANGTLPLSTGAYDEDVAIDSADYRRLSGMIELLPFMDETALWESIASPTEIDGVSYPAMGPAAFDEEYPCWKKQPPTFLCPSSYTRDTDFGLTNYAFCIGDATTDIHRAEFTRGAFGGKNRVRLSDVTDGTRHTIAMAEIGTRSNSSRAKHSVVGQFATNQPTDFLSNPWSCRNTLDRSNSDYYKEGTSVSKLGRGGRWSDGSAGYTLFNSFATKQPELCSRWDGYGWRDLLCRKLSRFRRG